MNTNVHSSRATVLSQASPNKTRGELSNRSSNRTATMTQSRFFSPQGEFSICISSSWDLRAPLSLRLKAKLPTNHRPENRNTYSFVPPSAEIIEVKDDEDIGEPVKISRKSPARRFSSPDPIDVIGKDGDATKRLKEKVQKHSNAHEGHRKRVPPSLAASDSLESIEDASTFDQNDGGREMKPPSGFASGSVRKLVDRFEANGALQQPIREIDLSKSLKRRMKPKITVGPSHC